MKLTELFGLNTHKPCTHCDYSVLAEEAAERYHNSLMPHNQRIRNNGYQFDKIDFMQGYVQAMKELNKEGGLR